MPDCPNFAANICAGPRSDDDPGCPGQTDIAVCRFRQALQSSEAESPSGQEAAIGYATEVEPDGSTEFVEATPTPPPSPHSSD